MQYVSETAQTAAFSRKVLQALGFDFARLKVPKMFNMQYIMMNL